MTVSIRSVAWILTIGGLAIPLIGTGFAGWPIVLGWAIVLLAVWLLKPLAGANRSQRVILAVASIPLLVLAATLFGLYLIPAAIAWLVAELRSEGREPA
jgi:hypothetical protein